MYKTTVSGDKTEIQFIYLLLYDMKDWLPFSTQTKIPLSEIHQILVQESLERISKNQGVTFDSLTDINWETLSETFSLD